MSRTEDFLSTEEEQDIIQAIREAEKNTSGEIRIHIEAHAQIAPIDRAKEVFQALKMGNTKEENGVLIYVAVNDRKFAIYGDRGIDKAVPDRFLGLHPRCHSVTVQEEQLQTRYYRRHIEGRKGTTDPFSLSTGRCKRIER